VQKGQANGGPGGRREERNRDENPGQTPHRAILAPRIGAAKLLRARFASTFSEGMATARHEIADLQRRLYRRQRQLINASVVGYNAAFRRYEAVYQERVRGFRRPLGYDAVLDQIARSDVVYVGDYHTLKQSQRAFAKIVRRAAARGREVVVALEFVQGPYQDALDAYRAGRIGERTFLERIRYRDHQVFDVWPNFKPVLDAARAARAKIYAIDSAASGAGSLELRDAYAAERVARAVREHPGALVLVLVGQLHVAPPHLPAQVKARLGPRGAGLKHLVVYQNCERIWFLLERQGLDHDAEAVEVRRGELCLINTPPVVAQASYLDWLDGDEEEEPGSAGPYRRPEAEGRSIRRVDAGAAERHFKELAHLIAAFLGLDPGEAIDEVDVYTSGDLSFLDRLRRRGDFGARELAVIKRQILQRESYFIPRANVAYLANLSLNHAAEEAAHFLRHAFAGGDGSAENERGLVDSFYARALEEAYAFFGSKVVNPRRKCPHEDELDALAGDPSTARFERRVAEFVLAHKQLERGRRTPVVQKLYTLADADLFNAVTHTLGYILGDKLYYALVRGRIRKSEVRELFLDPLDEEGAAFHTYLYLASRLDRVRVPRREARLHEPPGRTA
jgi:hypothetical protein